MYWITFFFVGSFGFVTGFPWFVHLVVCHLHRIYVRSIVRRSAVLSRSATDLHPPPLYPFRPFRLSAHSKFPFRPFPNPTKNQYTLTQHTHSHEMRQTMADASACVCACVCCVRVDRVSARPPVRMHAQFSSVSPNLFNFSYYYYTDTPNELDLHGISTSNGRWPPPFGWHLRSGRSDDERRASAGGYAAASPSAPHTRREFQDHHHHHQTTLQSNPPSHRTIKAPFPTHPQHHHKHLITLPAPAPPPLRVLTKTENHNTAITAKHPPSIRQRQFIPENRLIIGAHLY